jgi:hypothetical protein
MFRLARQFIAASIFVIPVFLGMVTISAGAATSQQVNSQTISPNSNLVGAGSSVRFDPSKLFVTDKSPHKCTPVHGGWSITNETGKTQTVLFHGSKAFSLKPSQMIGICASPGRYVWTLKSSPKAKLVVKVSP